MKAQADLHAGFRADLLARGGFIAKAMQPIVLGFSAVSYTHLDVYKRQGLPLGVQNLPDARFRFRGGPAELYIGAWPCDGGALYLTGEIVHINFDPINKCTPC